MSIGGRGIVVCEKIQDSGRHHLGFNFCLTFWHTCMYDLQRSLIHLPNFVQICAIVNELWAINEIQNGGRRHLEFIIFVHFGQMVYFPWQPSTFVQISFIYVNRRLSYCCLCKNLRWQPPPSWILFLFNIWRACM